MNTNDLLDLFRGAGALLEGHFQLSSGLHSAQYLQCALVLESPPRAEKLGRELAAGLTPCDTVVSPALGGVIIGHEAARALGVRAIFTERDAAAHAVLRRGFTLRPGERVVIVEDVVTTGLSTREVIEVVRAAGADVRGAAAIVDRSGGAAASTLGVPFRALLQLDVPAHRPELCPQCAAGVTLVKPGSRAAKG